MTRCGRAMLTMGTFVVVGSTGSAQVPSTTAPAHAGYLESRGPVFFVIEPRSHARVDARNAAVFRQQIALDLSNVSISVALDTIAARSGLQINYSPSLLSRERVTLTASAISVAGALSAVLLDAGLDVELTGLTRATLVKRLNQSSLAIAHRDLGRITGLVTDVATGRGLPDAAVIVEETALGTRTDGAGRYTLAGVASGPARITARSLGYASRTVGITVVNDSTQHVDFVLAQSAQSLEAVVVTGAGLQRRIELGTSVATISVDSVSRAAPVTNLTDVISGRAPSVAVVQTSGLAGSGPALRVRGRGSVTLSNDPIYIIDGVRMDGSPGGQVDALNVGTMAPTASRLNDLDPSEIETLEVLRGPSAATEYGTDAANGVIVITTKRGHPGHTRWSATSDQGASTMPVRFPDNYYSWGHTTDGTNTAVKCPLVSSPPSVANTLSSIAGTCTVDSVTRWQPLNHPETSLFGTGYRGHYALDVAGGAAQTQYFFGGAFTEDIGALAMPATEVARLERERAVTTLPRNQERPNQYGNASVRGRTSTVIGGAADVSVTASYGSIRQRSPNQNDLLLGALTSPGIRDSTSGYDAFGLPGRAAPGTTLPDVATEGVNRFTGGVSGTWRPAGWLNAHGTLGIDHASRTDEALTLAGQGMSLCGDPNCNTFGQIGYRSIGLYTTDLVSSDFGASATARITRVVSSKTSVGVQYVDRGSHGSATSVANLSVGATTANGATVLNQVELHDEAATLGSYLDETIGFADRLFANGALRVDAGSGFGRSYKAAVYPKASLSWVLMPDDRPTSLRLRAAYGQAGVQPPPGSALQLFGPAQTYYAGGTVASVLMSTVGTRVLRPERTEELEGGADIGLFGQRLTAEATIYQKLSHDALVNVPLEGSLGGGSQLINLGSVRNRGLELSVSARVLDTRALAWDLTVSGSDNENRLVTLGRGVPPIDQTVFFEGPYKQTPGFPIYGLWARRLRYRDTNHDGVIEANEVSLDSTPSYIGPSLAPRAIAINTSVTLFGGRVRIAGQLDHRGGQYLTNVFAEFSDVRQFSRATNDGRAPLASQARAVERLTDPAANTNSGYVEPATFTRLRELSVTYIVPPRLTSAFRARSIALTIAGRNLAMWTKYTGSDPEVSTVQGGNAVLSPGGLPTTVVNPDIVGDFGSVPQMRLWTFKVAIGF